MKKFLCLMLVFIMLFTLTACNKNKDNPNNPDDTNNVTDGPGTSGDVPGTIGGDAEATLEEVVQDLLNVIKTKDYADVSEIWGKINKDASTKLNETLFELYCNDFDFTVDNATESNGLITANITVYVSPFNSCYNVFKSYISDFLEDNISTLRSFDYYDDEDMSYNYVLQRYSLNLEHQQLTNDMKSYKPNTEDFLMYELYMINDVGFALGLYGENTTSTPYGDLSWLYSDEKVCDVYNVELSFTNKNGTYTVETSSALLKLFGITSDVSSLLTTSVVYPIFDEKYNEYIEYRKGLESGEPIEIPVDGQTQDGKTYVKTYDTQPGKVGDYVALKDKNTLTDEDEVVYVRVNAILTGNDAINKFKEYCDNSYFLEYEDAPENTSYVVFDLTLDYSACKLPTFDREIMFMDCGVGSLDFGTSGNQLGVKEWYPTSLIINDDITYVNSENPVIEHYYILTTVVDKISNPMVLIGDGIYSDVQYIEYVQ